MQICIKNDKYANLMQILLSYIKINYATKNIEYIFNFNKFIKFINQYIESLRIWLNNMASPKFRLGERCAKFTQ